MAIKSQNIPHLLHYTTKYDKQQFHAEHEW